MLFFLSTECCYDTELLRPPYCFEQIDSENSVGAAGRLPGNAQNPPGRPYVPTTAAVRKWKCLKQLLLPQTMADFKMMFVFVVITCVVGDI